MSLTTLALDRVDRDPLPPRWCVRWATPSMPAPSFWYYDDRGEALAVVQKMRADHVGKVTCDMTETCTAPVTHIDRKGYVYCTAHGLDRRGDQPCRKLRPWERRRVLRGEPLRRY